jgi:hypothetical protein
MSRNTMAGVVAAIAAAFAAAFAVTSTRDDAATTAATSQPQPPGPLPEGSVQTTIFDLENEWTRALVRRDTAAFRRLTVPGFIYTEDNVVMTQDEIVQAIATSPDTVTWAGNEEMKLHDYSPAAIVTGVLVVKAQSKGKPVTNRYRFTDTWLNRDGKWQAIAAQDYLIPK